MEIDPNDRLLPATEPASRRQSWRLKLDRPVRRVLPRSLLGRSLLILLIPLLVTQAISLELFYGSHLDVVSRRLTGAVAAEIAETLLLLERTKREPERRWIIDSAATQFQLGLTLRPRARLAHIGSTNVLGPMDEDLAAALKQSIHRPLNVDWLSDPHTVKIQIQLADGVLDVDAPRKRLDVGPIWLFVAWVAGSALLLFLIAALFMRNQVRAIRRLARAAEAFGMGRDPGPIRPEGAQEVRKAASAFNRMQERILRFVAQRTAMLAGVSHDLRTPLTRLRLTLAMMPQSGQVSAEALAPDVAEMVADVAEMDRMIEGYLSFARGEGVEQAEPVYMPALLEEAAIAAARAGAEVLSVEAEPMGEIVLRPGAIRRVLANLLENARRHGGRIRLAALADARWVVILVDDDGPGIPDHKREQMFRAFESGGEGGTGLGLTIARDIIQAHGGDIWLEQSPYGGLRARIRLPF
ncbi:ATP-binding protein [Acetobacteraceae bacterium KSS8]|uniref:histidine kinase n=1 Tax=Endosaccharibacter trunci TaxID=2812733 RepID=A0ABT1W923_9PROT|nr:ATP-binding protein [Acetobacteraceae bacterium KSS8]